LISQTRIGGGTHFYLNDGQLSTRQLTTTAGLVSDTYTYDAFGVTLASTGPTQNVYLYTGEQLDTNVGFYYLRARYYAQQQGRFITTDPEVGNIFEPTSLHRYLYAHADPVNYRDPSGRSADYNILGITFSFSVQSLIIATLVNSLVAYAGTMILTGGQPTRAQVVAAVVATLLAIATVTVGTQVLALLVFALVGVIINIGLLHFIAKQDVTANEVETLLFVGLVAAGFGLGAGVAAETAITSISVSKIFGGFVLAVIFGLIYGLGADAAQKAALDIRKDPHGFTNLLGLADANGIFWYKVNKYPQFIKKLLG